MFGVVSNQGFSLRSGEFQSQRCGHTFRNGILNRKNMRELFFEISAQTERCRCGLTICTATLTRSLAC